MMAAMPTTIPAHLDLFDEIARLKRERNAVLLAHYYQEPDIQDVADYIGDSLGLSQEAAKTKADVIVFAGVHFMAETAKILNPGKKVVLPDLEAGCSLAEGCPADAFAAFKARYPGHAVISYINCSAAVKALSDVICTSANAEKIVRSFPADRPLVFAPDKNLGAYLIKKLGRPMVLWPGTCQVHETFSEKKLVELKIQHPTAVVIAHPECEEAVLRHADVVASTTGLLQHAIQSPARTFIVATEVGILHQMQKACPDKTFIPAPPEADCSCNECPFMKRNTLEKVYLALRDLQPEITLPEELRLAALRPIQRMLELS
jgi:quinolinate synthase